VQVGVALIRPAFAGGRLRRRERVAGVLLVKCLPREEIVLSREEIEEIAGGRRTDGAIGASLAPVRAGEAAVAGAIGEAHDEAALDGAACQSRSSTSITSPARMRRASRQPTIVGWSR